MVGGAATEDVEWFSVGSAERGKRGGGVMCFGVCMQAHKTTLSTLDYSYYCSDYKRSSGMSRQHATTVVGRCEKSCSLFRVETVMCVGRD